MKEAECDLHSVLGSSSHIRLITALDYRTLNIPQFISFPHNHFAITNLPMS